MKKLLITLFVVLSLGAIGYTLYSLFFSASSGQPNQEPYVVPALNKEYRNDTYRFSLTMPAGFEARTTQDGMGGEVVVLEDPQAGGVGIQITVTPFDEALTTLTEARVRQDVPDLTITDVQTLEIGDVYKGLAFKSDNPVFDGASREVWFVFPKVTEAGLEGHYLYQISTYERLDPLLKALFATWQFF